MLTIGLVAAAGCGGGEDEWEAKRPDTVPASGVVTYKGEPVEGATIVFAPATPGPDAYSASGTSEAGGEFSVYAFEPGEGAVPGKYNVAVTKLETAPQQELAEGQHDEGTPPPPKHLLPEKYADPTKSGITVEIPAEGTEDLKIELQ
ncbi:MAG TPA: carboxypeptidase-like regulatory domain-containing protein [Planctomycetaceae bacterium]